MGTVVQDNPLAYSTTVQNSRCQHGEQTTAVLSKAAKARPLTGVADARIAGPAPFTPALAVATAVALVPAPRGKTPAGLMPG
jgi:hypothetical protein